MIGKTTQSQNRPLIFFIALYDANANLVVTYEYDAWGNCKITKDTNGIGELNPIRYRGYYYDTETGLYYLQSRYYDPEIGRFISADNLISDVGGDVLGNNVFVYCINNPVNLSDSKGQWPEWGAKLISVAFVASAVITATIFTVATYGAGSVAGVAMISAAITFAARTVDVVALQKKKSNSENCSQTKTAQNCVEAVYDNGAMILGFTPVTKSVATIGMGMLQNKVSKVFHNNGITKNSFLKSPGGKFFPALGVSVAIFNATLSIFSKNPEERASERGISLK